MSKLERLIDKINYIPNDLRFEEIKKWAKLIIWLFLISFAKYIINTCIIKMS